MMSVAAAGSFSLMYMDAHTWSHLICPMVGSGVVSSFPRTLNVLVCVSGELMCTFFEGTNLGWNDRLVRGGWLGCSRCQQEGFEQVVKQDF